MFVSSVSTIFMKTKKQTIMKTIYFTVISLFIALLSFGFSACSNDTEEVLEPEIQNTVKGTDTRDNDDRPYYWADGKKEYLSYVDNSSFVLFYEKDRGSVFNSLSELGVDCSTILEGDYSEKTNLIIEKGSAYDYPDDCRWMRVDLAYQILKDKLTDAIYITPLVANVFGQFAISNEFMISYGGSMSELEEITKEYKVEIMGRTDLFNIYYIWCTKDSEGNALEIANKIYESGKVSWTEPCFHGLGSNAAADC